MSFLVITKKQTRSLLLWSKLLMMLLEKQLWYSVRSPFGDIDILALFLGHDFGDIRILVDNGTWKNRKVIDITSSTLPNIQKQVLIGLHAFSGNDYVSWFFRKEKIAFWKAMLKRAEFIELFAGLGVTTDLLGTSALNIEKFVCFLYGDQTLNLDRFHTTIGSKMTWDNFRNWS